MPQMYRQSVGLSFRPSLGGLCQSRTLDHLADSFGEIPGFLKRGQLSSCPGGAVCHLFRFFQPIRTVQAFGNGLEEGGQTFDVLSGCLPFVGNGIDDLGIESVSGRSPFVLADQHRVAVVLIGSVVDLVG